ncbi:MAG: hypothetical protein WKF84_23030 [Pyrinomonadaceae bacterium]
MEPETSSKKMPSRHEKREKSQLNQQGTRGAPALSVIVTVVGGTDTVRRCLRALSPEANAPFVEIIVPCDCASRAVGELRGQFPEVNFHFIEDMGSAADVDLPSSKHRQYDRRRAIGVSLLREAASSRSLRIMPFLLRIGAGRYSPHMSNPTL